MCRAGHSSSLSRVAARSAKQLDLGSRLRRDVLSRKAETEDESVGRANQAGPSVRMQNGGRKHRLTKLARYIAASLTRYHQFTEPRPRLSTQIGDWVRIYRAAQPARWICRKEAAGRGWVGEGILAPVLAPTSPLLAPPFLSHPRRPREQDSRRDAEGVPPATAPSATACESRHKHLD